MAKEEYYCEGKYSKVEDLPFKGKAYHVSVSGGNDFEPIGMQTDKIYRKVFDEIAEFCKAKTKELDTKKLGGFHFIMCGGTSFIHGSAKASGKYKEPSGKFHLHIILYTNCYVLAGNEKANGLGYKRCYGGMVEKFLKKDKGFRLGVEVIPFQTCETVDYILQQRIEPDPLLRSSYKGIRLKSLLKAITTQYPKGKNYKRNLKKWDGNIRTAVKEFLEMNFFLFSPVAVVAKPIPIKILGRGGIFENELIQKAIKLANTRWRQKNAIRLEIQGVVTKFEEWMRGLPLIAHYLYRVYWNTVLIGRVNRIAEEPILHTMVTYSRASNAENDKVEYWTREKVDGRTTEWKEMKNDGWK